jgi:c-di-GMP-binding flagellar brake protein YcgR
MARSDNSEDKERRKFPRLFIELPLQYRVVNAPNSQGGMVVNMSEGGLLIQSVRDMPVGEKLNIEVLFPKEFALTHFEVFAEIIWKEKYLKEDWEGFRYGLRFIQISEGDHRKLKQLLIG